MLSVDKLVVQILYMKYELTTAENYAIKILDRIQQNALLVCVTADRSSIIAISFSRDIDSLS